MTRTNGTQLAHGTPQTAFAQTIAERTPGNGDFATQIPGLNFFRREAPTTPVPCLVQPSIVLVAQGEKQMWVGGEAYSYGTSHYLITSLDLPAESQVLAGSPEEPCVGLSLKLDLRMLAELIAHTGLPPRHERTSGGGVGLGSATPALIAPIGRLLELLNEPDAIPVLGPLILREIHYRLLIGDQAARLRHIASVDGQGHRIAKAIDWLKLNYSEPLRIEELAARVQMSPPTFHHHFRQLTAMSPLQYQKWLRLNEAKRLMLNESRDVSTAAFEVGYESPSQFSREYSRMFGVAPKRDIVALREQALNSAT
jgi:AraC-like DNA-binding protein